MIEPAYLWVPPRMGSYGDEAIDLARLAGRELDDEQCLAVEGMLSYGPGGRWAALEGCVLEPRQNGKTGGVLLPVVLFDLFLLAPDRIVWTAHVFRTARDAFKDFVRCIETAPELSRRVKHISCGHGEEYIELHSGAVLEFLARSKGGGRGLGGKRVVMDEALFLQASAMGALMPTLSAREDPQITYGSSGALESSEHLHSLIDRGRTGGDPSLVWIEWCSSGSWDEPPCELGGDCTHVRGSRGCALDDEELWKQANPALGRRITYKYVQAERRAMPPQEFGRERLGWHEAPLGAGAVLPFHIWAKREDSESEAAGRVGLGVDASPNLRSIAVGMSGIREDGRRHWQVLEHQPGSGWLIPYLIRLRDVGLEMTPIGIDPGSPAGALIQGIRDAGFEVAEISGRELVQAWGSFRRAVLEDEGRHLGQETLDQAIRDARNAPSGDVERFSRKKSSGDICPLVAVTLSDHAQRIAPELAPEPFALWGDR